MTNAESWWKRNLFLIVGFSVNLVVLGVAIGKQMQISSNQQIINESVQSQILKMDERIRLHHEDRDVHTDPGWKADVTRTQNRIEGKIDAFIMQSRK